MSQFSAYQNRSPATRQLFPYVVEIQANLLSHLSTTIVIPLAVESQVGNQPISRLCPVVELNGGRYVAMTPQIAGVSRKGLGPEVADLSAYRGDFLAAMDFAISGI